MSLQRLQQRIDGIFFPAEVQAQSRLADYEQVLQTGFGGRMSVDLGHWESALVADIDDLLVGRVVSLADANGGDVEVLSRSNLERNWCHGVAIELAHRSSPLEVFPDANTSNMRPKAGWMA